METVTFNITGAFIQQQVMEFITEGNFEALEKLISSFGMDYEDVIPKLLDGEFLFTGSSREDNLNMELNHAPIEIFGTIIKDCLYMIGLEKLNDADVLRNIPFYIKCDYAKKYITKERLKELLLKYPDLMKGYDVEAMSYHTVLSCYSTRGKFSAIIDKNGLIYPCDYEEHNKIVPLLSFIGVIDGYVDGDGGFISKVYGEHAYISNNRIMNNIKDMNPSIYRTLLGMCDNVFFDKYGNDIFPRVLSALSLSYNNGNKYGMLQILKSYGYNTPKIYDNINEISDTTNLIVRSSPKKSMAGLLNSYNTTKSELEQVIKKMGHDFNELCKDNTNSFHYFIQERLEGRNGVATVSTYFPLKNYKTPNYDINISISDNQGDVVNGVDGNVTSTEYNNIEDLCKKLLKQFDHQFSFQIEFVIKDDGDIVILQYRILPKTFIEDSKDVLDNCVHLGKIFKMYQKTFDKTETILVDNVSTLTREDLDGIKLIITAQKSNNAHILSYAISNEISVIYNADLSVIDTESDVLSFSNDYREIYLKK
jgi:hypothetical protein